MGFTQRQTDRQTDKADQTDQTDQTDKTQQTRQTDRQTNRQTDGRTDRRQMNIRTRTTTDPAAPLYAHKNNRNRIANTRHALMI